MIKNIIFDIGGVLTKFDPNDYLGAFGIDAKKTEVLSNAIFKNDFWKAVMIGEISPEDFKKSVIEASPSLKNEIEIIFAKENDHKRFPPLEEGREFLLKMKQQGYNIYILSNIAQDLLDYFKENFTDVMEVISGGVYSCEVHLRKPDSQIYQLILDKYNLVPQETLFLDDSARNIEAACELGIVGYVCAPLKNKTVFEEIKKLLH